MADNVTTTSYTTATDDIAGQHYQRVKSCVGADGIATDPSAGAGAVDAGTQRSTLASDDPAVTALEIMDDWDESDRAKVNPIAGQAGVAAGAGAVDALTQRITAASDDPIVANQAGTVVDVTLSLDTAGCADGDLLADAQEIASAVRVNAGKATLRSIQLLDEDDQGVALDLLFLDAATSLGTENNAADISDANARGILGVVSIASGDYVDLVSCQIANKNDVGLKLKAAAATTSLYVAAITRGGAPTYTASGIRLKLGFDWD